MKKLLFAVLALTLLLSAGTALAAGPTVTVARVSANAGEEVSLAVALSGGDGVRNFDFEVTYPAALTLTAVDTADAICSGGMIANLEKGLLCFALASDAREKEGTLFTLRFTVAADAAAGSYPVSLRVREGGAFSSDAGPITAAFVSGGVDIAAQSGGTGGGTGSGGSTGGGGTITINDPEISPLPSEPLQFSDVAAGDWYYDCVMGLAAQGVVNGYQDGTFWPNAAVSAGEALKLILLASGCDIAPAKAGHWAEPFRAYAAERGWLSVDAGKLDDPITRLDIATLLAKANGIAPVDETVFPDTDDPCAAALGKAGLLIGYEDGSFGPARPMTRAELCVLLWRLGGKA